MLFVDLFIRIKNENIEQNRFLQRDNETAPHTTISTASTFKCNSDISYFITNKQSDILNFDTQ